MTNTPCPYPFVNITGPTKKQTAQLLCSVLELFEGRNDPLQNNQHDKVHVEAEPGEEPEGEHDLLFHDGSCQPDVLCRR